MKLVMLGGIVSYIVGTHKYYEPEVLPAETDESSNTFPISMFELTWFYSNHAFTSFEFTSVNIWSNEILLAQV